MFICLKYESQVNLNYLRNKYKELKAKLVVSDFQYLLVYTTQQLADKVQLLPGYFAVERYAPHIEKLNGEIGACEFCRFILEKN